MADNVRKLISLVRSAAGSTIVQGTIVTINSGEPNKVVKSTANTPDSLKGTIGVALETTPAGYPMEVVTAGDALVHVSTGLTLAAGDPLYVSAGVTGFATNVAPANAFLIGKIKDPAPFGAPADTVLAVIEIGGGAGAGDSGSLLKFSILTVHTSADSYLSLADTGPLQYVTGDTEPPATGPSYPMSRSATASKLYARVSSNALTHNATLTVYKNGIATAVTVTITAGVTGTFSDLINSASFAEGDRLQLVLFTLAEGAENLIALAAEVSVVS